MTLEGICKHLAETFHVRYLSIKDESALHAGHNPASKNMVTHIGVVLVSTQFEGLSRVKRHQRVYQCLGGFMKKGLHAIKMAVYTPSEWDVKIRDAQ